LGRPSNPSLPTVTVEGSVLTVVLSTDYPGTEGTRSGNNFRFELQFTKGGISTYNLIMQLFTPSTLTTPVNTTYSTALDFGSYTVRVIAVNEHGSSESVMSEAFVVTEPCSCITSTDNTTLILIVIIVVQFLLFVVTIIGFVLVIIKCRRDTSHRQPPGSNKLEQVYDEMGMESCPRQNEITIDKNPAYDSVDGGKPSTVTAVEYEEVGGAGKVRERRDKSEEGAKYSNFAVL
jgi:hypothetical protein